jgi:hypothetical protein
MWVISITIIIIGEDGNVALDIHNFGMPSEW